MRINYRTPAGWQRLRCHGGLMFRRNGHGLMVRKKDGTWRIWQLATDGVWDALEMRFDTWIDGVKAAEKSLEPRKP